LVIDTEPNASIISDTYIQLTHGTQFKLLKHMDDYPTVYANLAVVVFE